MKDNKEEKLDKLMDGVTEDNIHGDTDWGKPSDEELREYYEDLKKNHPEGLEIISEEEQEEFEKWLNKEENDEWESLNRKPAE